MNKHNCKNPKYCPICRQKIKKEIIKDFKKHPEIIKDYKYLMENFNLSYRTAQSIMRKLELRRIIIRRYVKTKRLTKGSGISVRFLLSQNNLDLIKFNSKHG